MVPDLLQGYTVVVADTEGETTDFAAGPEYGINTLDSLRAALASPATGLPGTTKIGLIGYSGGAIATEWAAELAPSYAPDINQNLVGAAFGGVLVDPAHNLHYVSGSSIWAGVIPMAIITFGVPRATGGLRTEVTFTVGWPSAPVDRYSNWTAVTGRGIPATEYGSIRVLSTVPGAILASGVAPW